MFYGYWVVDDYLFEFEDVFLLLDSSMFLFKSCLNEDF
jgi:hypothetical protein